MFKNYTKETGINRKLYQFWSLREFCITENSYDFVLSSFVKRNPFFLNYEQKINNEMNNSIFRNPFVVI